MLLLILISVLVCITTDVVSLNNGLVRTPPMGWISWARYRCETNCNLFPNSCISQWLYTGIADKMVSDGYLDAGYQFVNIDDCWLANDRDANGQLVANSTRFPNGIPWLASYMHQRGLKLGIYEDFGNTTCAGYPGSLGHLETDANTFASWDVDMLKFDGCNSNVSWMSTGYPEMEMYLNATNLPIVYSCEWPLYEMLQGLKPNFTAISQTCNLWRNYDDVQLSWNSIQGIINWYDHNQDFLIPVNGPGQWNDPDMIIVGNIELTVDQAETQFAIWSIWSAPLMMSNDLHVIENKFKNILLNKNVIAVNQDPLGIMGRLTVNTTQVGVYVKPMTPYDEETDEYSYAIVFFNRDFIMADFAVQQIASLGLTNPGGYNVVDLYSNVSYGLLYPTSSFHCKIKATGVVMVKATLANI